MSAPAGGPAWELSQLIEALSLIDPQAAIDLAAEWAAAVGLYQDDPDLGSYRSMLDEMIAEARSLLGDRALPAADA